MNEGTAYGPAAGADTDMAELVRLADELVEEIGAARRHYEELRAVLDGRAPAREPEDDGVAQLNFAAPVTEAVDAEEPAEPGEPDEAPEPAGALARPKVRRRSRRGRRGAAGARLIALNMALSNTPRDETARYLEQNFELDDQDGLLDEVYSRLGDGDAPTSRG